VARVFVITGPSGVGKGTLVRGLLGRVPGLGLSVSATTRAPRAGERERVDYHFLSPEEFERRAQAGEFVEHAEYSGQRYGTLRGELERHLHEGTGVVLEIEVQGARQVRESVPDAVQVFIRPPSIDELRQRLERRATDDRAAIERRLTVAREELQAEPEFGYVVENDEVDRALDELAGIIEQELPGRAGS
jgi:guanylate kinase